MQVVNPLSISYTKNQSDERFINVSLDSASIGTPNPVNADTLSGKTIDNFVLKEEITPQRLTPTWENGFTDSGATRIWRIGSIIVCQFNVKIPTISRGDWIGILKIPDVNPGTNVNGRISTVAGGEARDYLVTTGGELRAYLTASDSGHTLLLPLVFVSIV